MPVTIISGDSIPNPGPKEIGLANAVAGREDDYPVLARAVADKKPIGHPLKFEWEFEDEDGEIVTWWNWTQILRTPWGMSRTQEASRMYADEQEYAEKKMLEEHLRKVEQTLAKGYLFQNFSWHVDEDTGLLYKMEHRGMGGVEFYLGRELRPSDTVSLRVLRDLAHWNRTAIDMDGTQGEYLCEISLVVIPG